MANAVYTLTFSDRIGDTYTVEIWSKAVNTNPAIAIKGSETPLVINWRSVSDIFEPVISSEAVLEVISETDLFWKSFFTATRGAWILKVYRAATLIWTGQNITESYSEPYLVTPYKSQIKFSDLGDLDFLYYQPTSTTFYSGFQSLAEILFNCTNRLEFQLDANEYTNCINLEGWNNASVTDKSLLANTFLDARVFVTYENEAEIPLTCMQVLKKVMRSIGCRLFQASTATGVTTWHIQRIEEMIDSNALTTFGLDHTTKVVSVSSFVSDLKRNITNNTTDFQSPTYDISPVDQNQDLKISERFNEALYKYTTIELFRKAGELLLNNKFLLGIKTHNDTTNFPKYFQISSDITNSNACQVAAGAEAPNKILLFRGEQNGTSNPPMPGFRNAQGTYILQSGSNPTIKYLRTTGTESGDTSDAGSENMSNIQVAVVDNLRLKIKGKIFKGIDYSWAQQQGLNNETFLTGKYFEFGIKVKITYANGAVYHWWWMPNQNAWMSVPKIIFKQLGTKGFSSNTFSGVLYHENDFEILLDSPFFPQNGIANFSLWFYIPRSPLTWMQPIAMAAVSLDEISLRYVTDGDFSDDILKTRTLFVLTDAKENAYTFDISYGDGPADYCLSSFRYGVVSAADKYKKTSSWRKLSVATARTAADLFNLIPAQRLISGYQRIITGDYIGKFNILNTLNINDGVNDKKYLIMGDSWNVKSSIHSIVMNEITAQSISTTSTSTGGVSPARPVSRPGSSESPERQSDVFSDSESNSQVMGRPAQFTNQSEQTRYPG